MACLSLLASAMLVACTFGTASQPPVVATVVSQATTPTATQAGTAPTPTIVQAQASPTPAACGTVELRGPSLTTDPAAATAMEDCFAKAFKQCQPAMLAMHVMGVDTGVTHVFQVASGASGANCQIQYSVEHTIFPARTPTTQTGTCSGLSQTADGLLFQSCGSEGDILVPSKNKEG